MISICIPVSSWLNQRTELAGFCSAAIMNIFRCSILRPVCIRSNSKNQWLVDCARGDNSKQQQHFSRDWENQSRRGILKYLTLDISQLDGSRISNDCFVEYSVATASAVFIALRGISIIVWLVYFVRKGESGYAPPHI